MKIKKILPLLLITPFMAGCKGKELVIPTVDVENMTISLPAKPVYNTGAIASDDNFDYVDFYEISDFHGAVNHEEHSDEHYIGLPVMATFFNKKRELNPGGTIVLSSGDMFQGSVESNLTRGYIVNYAMNYMGFECMTLGNHEFDWTDEWIKKNANLEYEGHKIPFLAANLVDTTTNLIPDFVQPYHIVTRGTYKIGIIGTVGGDLEKSILGSALGHYEFSVEKPIVEEKAKYLRETENCDIVVWSTHNGLDLIQPVEGIDAIFGGHAHENRSETINNVPAVATKNYGRGIGHIQLKIDKATKEVSCAKNECIANPYFKVSPQTEDEGIKSIISQYDEEIGKIKNIKLGKTNSDLKKDKEVKNICVDAMMNAAKDFAKDIPEIDESRIIAAYHNINGGVRSDISAGKITYGKIYAPFPFDNAICLYKIKGSILKQQTSQLKSYAVCKTIEKKDEIKANEDYYIVVTDFIALSSQYLKPLLKINEEDLIFTGKVVREEVAQYIYKKNKIDAKDYGPSVSRFVPLADF